MVWAEAPPPIPGPPHIHQYPPHTHRDPPTPPHTAFISRYIALSTSQQGSDGTVSTGPAQLRDFLARPLLHLLHSPLLDTLVALQHVMTEKLPLQRIWESTAEASVYQTPTSMEADAEDSEVSLQVGYTRSYYVGVTTLGALCFWVVKLQVAL